MRNTQSHFIMRKDGKFTWPSINKVIRFRITNFYFRHLYATLLSAAQRLAVEPPGRLCAHRFSIQQAPSKTLGALTPGRRPGRFQPRVGRRYYFLIHYSILQTGEIPSQLGHIFINMRLRGAAEPLSDWIHF